MYGLIDISHRYKFLSAPHRATELHWNGEPQHSQAKKIQSHYTRLLYDHFSRTGYASLEEYVDRVIDSYTDISREAAWNRDLDNIEFYRVFDTFYYWRSKDSKSDSAKAISQFVENRSNIFGDIFKTLGTHFRDVDEETSDLEEFVRTVSNVFALDDVLLWKYNPTNEYLVQIASTLNEKINADIHRGLVARCIQGRRAQYYPNIRKQSDYEEIVQHREVVKRREWKGMLVCPLHLSKNLVGVIGLYSKHDLIFSKVEIGLILYMLANLSKRVSREVFDANTDSPDSGDLSYEKIMRLAPTIYVGTKTTYRLHSIKNKVRAIGEVLKEVKPLMPKKPVNEVNWQKKFGEIQTEVGDIFQELEACLLIGSQRTHKLFKKTSVKLLVAKVRRMMAHHVSAVTIKRTLILDFDEGAQLYADLTSLEQAFYNVIENAFFFLAHPGSGPKQPELMVRIVQRDSHLVCEIEDNALGMSDEERDNFRVLYFSGRLKNGSGVGLWMTDRIVNEHFGDFDIPSSDHTGTRCRILLPVEDDGDGKKRRRKNERLLED